MSTFEFRYKLQNEYAIKKKKKKNPSLPTDFFFGHPGMGNEFFFLSVA